MDLSQYILALKARRKAFVTVLAVTIFTAIVAALVIPKRYDATATILIDARDEQTLATAHLSPRERAGYIFTQMELIASGKVAHKVVRDLKLAQQPGMREDWERDTGGTGSIEEWIATGLLEKLKVDSGASNIIIVKYSSSDAKQASDVANAFAKAYLDVALELRTEPSREAGQWFDEQLKTLRADVTGAQTKLASYQKEKGIAGGDERMDVEYTRLAELNAELSRQKAATMDAQTRYTQAQDLIKDGVSLEAFPEVLSNGYIVTVKAALQAAEGRLAEQSQHAYDSALTLAMAVKVDSKDRKTNLAMLTPAVKPLKPAVPKVGLIAALYVVIGLLLAAGMIYVLELMDRRVRSRTDLESRLAVPSLGLLSRWTPAGGRLLPSPNSNVRTTHALPRPW